jgi:hypothetical protein
VVALRVDKIAVAMNLLIFSAFLNTVSFFFLIWYLVREKKKGATLRAAVYVPFFIKEVYFFFYVLWKGVRINTLHDNLSAFLAENILEIAANTSQYKINQIYAIQYHIAMKPIGLKFFGFRVSYGNFWFLLTTALLAVVGFLVRMHDIIDKGHI